MKAVILAAGKGERMIPLTHLVPKPMLKIMGRPVLDHVFDAFPDEVTEVIVAVRYLSHQITGWLKHGYRGRRIRYVEGSERGTAYSFKAAHEHFAPDERFLFVYGDEVPDPEDVRAALRHPSSIVVFRSKTPWTGGVVNTDENGRILKIEEKPERPQTDLVADGIMVLHTDIFEYASRPNSKGEHYFTAMLDQYVRDRDVTAVVSPRFIGDITSPSDLERVSRLLWEKRLSAPCFSRPIGA